MAGWNFRVADTRSRSKARGSPLEHPGRVGRRFIYRMEIIAGVIFRGSVFARAGPPARGIIIIIRLFARKLLSAARFVIVSANFTKERRCVRRDRIVLTRCSL